MSLLTVQLTHTLATGANIASGNDAFSPNGSMQDADGDSIFIDFVDGNLDSTGSMSVELYSSDNWPEGSVTYNVLVRLGGSPTIEASNIPLLNSDGDTQDLIEWLTDNGWQPDVPSISYGDS
jgi:hypothetical protein